MNHVAIQKTETAPLTRGITLGHAAGVYDILSPVMTFYQEDRLSLKAVKLFNLRGGEHILDVGCGTGTLTIKIAKQLKALGGNFQVTGLDAAPEMIDVCKRKAKGVSNLDFDVAAAEKLPYADNSFDAVISTFFFHHIDYELKYFALKEIKRVLKESGKLVIVDVAPPTNWFGALCAWSGYYLFKQDEIKENIKGILIEAIHESGFSKFETVSQHMGYVGIYNIVK